MATKQTPILLKQTAAWDGIKLTHYRFRAGALPEHHSQEHHITLTLSNQCRGELRTSSGLRVRGSNKGAICVIPAGQSFAARIDGESEQLVMELNPSLVWRAAADSGSAHQPELVAGCAPHDTVISGVGMALFAEMQTTGVGGRLYAESLANVLAVHLLRRYAGDETAAPHFVGGLSQPKLALVLAFIGNNYERDLSLNELAAVAGLSPFHFSREFKRTTGVSPHQYLIKFRIEKAKSLLVESRLPLVEVGYRSGFSHQSHFSRLFRRLTGTTPQSYRLRFQS